MSPQRNVGGGGKSDLENSFCPDVGGTAQSEHGGSTARHAGRPNFLYFMKLRNWQLRAAPLDCPFSPRLAWIQKHCGRHDAQTHRQLYEQQLHEQQLCGITGACKLAQAPAKAWCFCYSVFTVSPRKHSVPEVTQRSAPRKFEADSATEPTTSVELTSNTESH